MKTTTHGIFYSHLKKKISTTCSYLSAFQQLLNLIA